MRRVTPCSVTATSFSIALEYRSQLGTGYTFDLELEQRAPEMKRYRMRIAGDGSMSLWRSESGVLVSLVTTAPGVVQGTFKPTATGQHVLVAETETGRIRHRFLVDASTAQVSASEVRQDQSSPGNAAWPGLLTALALIGWLLTVWWERR